MTASIGRSRANRRFHLAWLLLAGTCLSPLGAAAQNATWLASPGSSSFFTATNWTPAAVPQSIASFGASNTTSITLDTYFAGISGFQFNAGAPAYTFTVPVTQYFSLGAAGVVNNSTNSPTFSVSGNLTFTGGASAGNATINVAPTGSLVFIGSNAGNATILNSGTLAFFGGDGSLGSANIVTQGGGVTRLDDMTAGSATITTQTAGVTRIAGRATAANATFITQVGGVLSFFSAASGGQARFINNGILDISNQIGGGITAGSIEGSGAFLLGGNQLTTGSNNLSTTVSGVISGFGGSLTKVGTGTLILTGANTYTAGTTVSGGVLQGNTTSLQGPIVNNSAVVFDQPSTGTYSGVMSGTGVMIKQNTGTLILTGANTFAGGTTVTGGGLVVNGSLASGVTVGSAAALGGSGVIIGNVINNGALSPGNSIGTLTVSGTYLHNGGNYQVEVNGAGQSDMLRVSSGTAFLNGGVINVIGAPGSFNRSTTYTIVNTTGGVSGTFSGVAENFAFLSASLRYDANNAYLTLFQGPDEFQNGGRTGDERAVGRALDQVAGSASGDFATVLGALTSVDNSQGPAVLDALSGQPYADFGTANVAAGLLFLNTLGNQMAGARSGIGTAPRVALAEACGSACDGAVDPRLGAWISGMAGLGSVEGNSNASTFTYNLAGAAVGIDYRLDPRFLVGFAVGYSGGRQWVDTFLGNGSTNNYSAALYASFTQAGFYADAAAGYTYSDNQLQRPIQIPGLATRNASGRTGANQFIGQVEGGYRFGIYDPAQASVTPFARLQIAAVSQNAFGETGANSINLNVAQQNTTSTRTVLGADLGGKIPLAEDRTLDIALRLGWSHDYAETTRPITASFAGAPDTSFTVYGAQPQRDAAVIGLGANTRLAEATSVYIRYDGEIAGRDSAHAFTAGFRMTW